MRIRYYGHVGQQTGYGKAAEQLCLALALHPEVELEIFPDWERIHPELMAVPLRSFVTDESVAKPDPDVIIVHSPPADCWRISERIKRQASKGETPPLGKAVFVAYTTWEGTGDGMNPDIIYELRNFDQVWVPSRVTQKAVELGFIENYGSPGDKVPVKVVPHTFYRIEKSSFVKAEGAPFRFYYVGAWTSRKNPQGLIRAFASEFTNRDNVELYLQSTGTPEVLYHLALASTGLSDTLSSSARLLEARPKILFSNAELSDDEMAALHRTGDVFVTAARGEAWNLPAFEAMLGGRHVISPRHLGSDEFLGMTSAALYKNHETYAYLDAQAVSPLPGSPPGVVAIRTTGAQGMSSRTTWLEPDLMDLGQKMRHAYQMRLRTIDINYDPVELFGYEAVARKAVTALQEIIAS